MELAFYQITYASLLSVAFLPFIGGFAILLNTQYTVRQLSKILRTFRID